MATKQRIVFALDADQLKFVAEGWAQQATRAQSVGAAAKVSGICEAIATMIGGAAGVHQMNLMDAAAKAGFAPEFYGSGIRVTWKGGK